MADLAPHRRERTARTRGRVLLVRAATADPHGLSKLLVELGFDTRCTNTLDEACDQIALALHAAVVVDVGMIDKEGLRRLEVAAPRTPVVVLASIEDERRALWAVQQGASDYLTDGLLDAPLLLRTLRCAGELKRAHAKLDALSGELARRRRELDRLASRTDRMSEVASKLGAPLEAAERALDALLARDGGRLADDQRRSAQAARASLAVVRSLFAELTERSSTPPSAPAS